MNQALYAHMNNKRKKKKKKSALVDVVVPSSEGLTYPGLADVYTYGCGVYMTHESQGNWG
jgi:hypothetical protein